MVRSLFWFYKKPNCELNCSTYQSPSADRGILLPPTKERRKTKRGEQEVFKLTSASSDVGNTEQCQQRGGLLPRFFVSAKCIGQFETNCNASLA
jgi:hypothetical protein